MYSSMGPSGDRDVASRACTGTCAFWRVPARGTGLTPRNATRSLKLSQFPMRHKQKAVIEERPVSEG